MSNFNKVKGCINGCGSSIYFDVNSKTGHPTADIWKPLEFKNGLRTDNIHICPNKKQNGSLTAVTATAAAITTSSKLDLDNLAVIKVIAAALNEYIAIKERGN